MAHLLTVIAWIWARTVKSPNPAFSHVDVPLATTFILSSKDGKEAWIEPIVKGDQYHFVVQMGKPPKDAENGTKLARGANFRCILSNSPIEQKHIRDEFKAKRAGERLMAIVAEGKRSRVYLSPIEEHEKIARTAKPEWRPEIEMNQDSKDLISGRGYGFMYWHEIFTPRQLVALTTFSDLVLEAVTKCKKDALNSGMSDDGKGLDSGGIGATAYAEAVGIYLAFAVDKGANYWSSLCAWHQTRDGIVSTFGRQAIPMVWDYAEANPLSDSSGNYLLGIEQAVKMIVGLGRGYPGVATQAQAQSQNISNAKIISTDPPYYDNVPYADISDFFYVWLRRTVGHLYPEHFA